MAGGQRLMALPREDMVGGLQAAFLIDADNFSDSVALNAAWLQVQARTGRVAVCRAYGGAQRLHTLATVWNSLGARTFPNLALEKNTTDAALIADAVALHFQQGVRLFAIASGDADFAPLAVRLREWGCEVWCFAMESTLFAGAQAYYDRVVRFFPSPVANAEPPAPKPLFSAVVAAAAPAVTKPPALPEEVVRILKLVPGLHEAPQQLSQVVPVLRQQSVLGKTTKSTAFFARYAEHFKLSPPGNPTHVAYTVPRTAVAPAVVSVAEKSATGTLQAMRSFPVAPTAAPAAALAPWPWKVPPVLDPQTAPPLLPELHGLRCVLLQLALRRITVDDLLRAVPEVMAGQLMDLGSVSKKLCDQGVVASSAHGRAVLMAYPSSFRLLPPEAPNAVQYIG